jgi:hypothetical protein
MYQEGAMGRWIISRLVPLAVVGMVAGWLAAPALADWQLKTSSTTSVAYNQGITFDETSSSFYFDGVSSTSNSAVYRTNSSLARSGSNPAVIPATKEGYNHVGDLSFDPAGRRLLLPLECYYPNSTPSNTCGSGAFGVVDPTTLTFLYYVKLWTPQIQKAMWNEISPDGAWIWTSSGTHLLAYKAASVNQQTADNQRAGVWGGLGGKDLGSVLSTGDVTGAAFYAGRLFLALNRGTFFQVVSYGIGVASDGSPTLLSTSPTIEITLTKSSSNSESEGLAVTGVLNGSYPLGGALHWQTLPSIKLYSRILNYTPGSGGTRGLRGGSLRAARCVVPQLSHRTLKSAKRLLRVARCRLGHVTLRNASYSPRAKITAQKPKPGTRLPARARVSVLLGR